MGVCVGGRGDCASDKVGSGIVIVVWVGDDDAGSHQRVGRVQGR